jgi:CRP-like cAMP-binding protein
MEQYMKVLKSIRRMSSELETHIREHVKPIVFSPHHLIQHEKTRCGHILFIEKGVAKMFDSLGTIAFLKENDFILGHMEDSSLLGSHAHIPGIEALEEITAWDFTPEMIASTIELFPRFNDHISGMFIKGMIKLNELNKRRGGHDQAALLLDFLRQESPDLLKRLPPKEIAIFLGVSEKVWLHMQTSNMRMPGSGKHLRRNFS